MSLVKKLLGASTMMTMAGVLARIVAIFSAPILTALLGPAPYGVMALLSSTITLGAMIGILGIDLAYTRFASTEDQVENRKVEAYCWRYSLRGACAIALLIILVSGIGGAELIGLNAGMLVFAALGVVLTVVVNMSKVYALLRSNYKYIAGATVISAVLATGLTILLAVYWRQDVWPLLVGALMGYALNILIQGMPRPSLLLKKVTLTKQQRTAVITFGFMGSAMTAPLYWVMTTADRWIINGYLDQVQVGIYSFTYNIAILGQMLNAAFVGLWRAEASKIYEQNRQAAADSLGNMWGIFIVKLAIAWLIVTAAGGDIIQLLADESFHDGISLVPWIAGGVFFYGLSQLSAIALVLTKNMKPFTIAYVVFALFSLGVNFILVPRLGITGAAITQMVSFALLAAVIFYMAQKSFELHINYRPLLVVLPLIVLAGVAASISWNDNPLTSLLLKFPAGVLLSVVVVCIARPQWFAKGMNTIVTYLTKNTN